MTPPAASPRIRQVSAYAQLLAQIQDAGLLRRRHGYYWTRITLLVTAFGAIWAAFFLIVAPTEWPATIAPSSKPAISRRTAGLHPA